MKGRVRDISSINTSHYYIIIIAVVIAEKLFFKAPPLLLLTLNRGCPIVEQRAQGHTSGSFSLSPGWNSGHRAHRSSLSQQPEARCAWMGRCGTLSPIVPPFPSLPFLLSLLCSLPPSFPSLFLKYNLQVVKGTHAKCIAKWTITCVCHHHQSAASFSWEIMSVVVQLGHIQPAFVHKMVWLWVPTVYRGLWLLNSSVPSTPAQIAGSERLHQGNFPTQRPCRVLSTCWGRNLSPTDLCKAPDGRISGSILDSSVMWMSCPGWGTTSSGSISASPCLWCGLSCGWGPHSCIPWSSTSTEPRSRIRTRLSAENRSEVFWFHPWPLISFLYCF